MTAEQKQLVQASYAALTPVADLLGDIFYNRLFEVDPPLKYLFPVDMNHQGKILMDAVSKAVAGLNCMETLEAAMQELGLRHAMYGVKDRDYQTAGQALLWTLRLGLGDAAFTNNVRQAWVEFYAKLSAAMIRGAAQRAVKA